MSDAAVHLLTRWQAGDQEAATLLFRRYAGQLIGLARSRLSGKVNQRFDAEDVVQSAYRSFFLRARAGQYDCEKDDDLWQLLVSITLHKLHHHVERHTARKRAVKAEMNYGTEDTLLGIQVQLL